MFEKNDDLNEMSEDNIKKTLELIEEWLEKLEKESRDDI